MVVGGFRSFHVLVTTIMRCNNYERQICITLLHKLEFVNAIQI